MNYERYYSYTNTHLFLIGYVSLFPAGTFENYDIKDVIEHGREIVYEEIQTFIDGYDAEKARLHRGMIYNQSNHSITFLNAIASAQKLTLECYETLDKTYIGHMTLGNEGLTFQQNIPNQDPLAYIDYRGIIEEKNTPFRDEKPHLLPLPLLWVPVVGFAALFMGIMWSVIAMSLMTILAYAIASPSLVYYIKARCFDYDWEAFRAKNLDAEATDIARYFGGYTDVISDKLPEIAPDIDVKIFIVVYLACVALMYCLKGVL